MDDVTPPASLPHHHVTHAGRRISFQPEAVFQSVVQDGDSLELYALLRNSDLFQVDLDLPNHSGITALHHSVLQNNVDTVKLLLTSGADPTLADVHGVSPLHTASACGFLHVASMLLVFGADVAARTEDGDLPVDFAKDSDMLLLLHNEMVAAAGRRRYLSSLLVYEGRKLLLWCLGIIVFYASMLVDIAVQSFANYTKSARRKQRGDDQPEVSGRSGGSASDKVTEGGSTDGQSGVSNGDTENRNKLD